MGKEVKQKNTKRRIRFHYYLVIGIFTKKQKTKTTKRKKEPPP